MNQKGKFRKDKLDFKIGFKFESWTIISDRNWHASKCKTPFYFIECKCGYIRKATPNQISQVLRNGFHQDLKSECLQCIKQTRLKQKPIEVLLNSVLTDYKNRNQHKFELSDQRAFHLFQQHCFYCGIEPSNLKKTKAGSVKYNGIDRIDSSKGYTPENVVTCCRRCNVAKNDQTLSEFTEWYTRLYKYNLRRSERQLVGSSEPKRRASSNEEDDMT